MPHRYNTVLNELFAVRERLVDRVRTGRFRTGVPRPCAVADDTLAAVFVADTELRRFHCPYDGGADVILTTPGERDVLRERYADWLPLNSAGL
ncbi:hypothetical protein ACIQI8_21195 [Streptomyces sp. NPDC092369]|uniref:DUF3885 domain-containing protein n=1 Tax=Streptomyces sp. NPDC092369 TaxID=3366015 RepID=UPI00380F2B78